MNSMVIQPKKFREIPENTEQEIVELERKLAEKKQELEEKKEVKQEKEIIKEIIKEKTEKPAPLKATTVAPSVQKVIVKKVKELKGQEKERQIQLLTDLAFEKGVAHATEVAKKLEDPYILDEFHDTLVDELYSYLAEQGKLKRI